MFPAGQYRTIASWGDGSQMIRYLRRRVSRDDARSDAGQRGAAAVEFALVAPLLFLLVFGIIDFGFGFHAWDASENAAREAARVAAVDPNTNTIIARARGASGFLDQSKLNVAVTCSHNNGGTFGACGASNTWLEGDIVRVTVTYDYDFMTPLGAMVGMGSSMHQTAVSEARFEGQ
jgi:Flp pilus assembly protein TadG